MSTREMVDRNGKPSKRAGMIALVVVTWIACAAIALAETPYDRLLNSLKPTADVNDFAGVLTPAEKESLEQRCKQLQQKTGAQLAVVILKSLEGGEIDDFTNKLFARWGVGEKTKNNGVMLLVALEDRKARIEVGYGLEPILPDALAGRILREQLFPSFKQQQYAAGLSAAVGRIGEIVERNEPPKPEELADPEAPLATKLIVAGFSAVFVAVGSFLIGLALGARVGSLILVGLMFGGIPAVFGWLLAAPIAPLVHLPVALLLGWFGWRTGRSDPQQYRPSVGRGRRAADDWIWAGGGSGGSSWSSGGGGFSGGGSWGGFGGGSSGGGGASGSW